jgi:hypothetical protein
MKISTSAIAKIILSPNEEGGASEQSRELKDRGIIHSREQIWT